MRKTKKEFLLLIITFCFTLSCSSQYSIYKKINPSKLGGRDITVTTDFKFPLGYPNLKGYHDAKPFGVNNHLGCDLNKDGNGNNDFGDTIKSIGYGFVTVASEAGLNIMHKTIIPKYPYIISVYFHCDKLFVDYGDKVVPGQPIATVGKKYTTLAHLHFEIVTDTLHNPGDGFYGSDPTGFLDPVKFINKY